MVTELTDLSLADMRNGLDSGTFSSTELTRAHLQRIEAVEGSLHAFLHVDEEGALKAAGARDQQGGGAGAPLSGIPLALKDNLCTARIPTTCGSRFLADYRPPYDATVVDRLRRQGAVILGKTNMDEFGMGSSCENSAFGATCNPLDLERVPGGSSGGSAAAVAARAAAAALGTDTGGSIRQPAALCGLVGVKPTWGRVSRYGLVAFASSLDQIGPLARSVEDAGILLEAIWGPDARDATCDQSPPPGESAVAMRGLRLGLPRQLAGLEVDEGVRTVVESALATLAAAGAEIIEVDLPYLDLALPAYYVIATAEASANLARFDGIRYGVRQEGRDLLEVYEESRGQGFGAEVRRRIILGTYGLSAGYSEAMYQRAQMVRDGLGDSFRAILEQVDLVVTPTSPCVAFPLGERTSDPVRMYAADTFTVPVSLAGLPAASLPCGASEGLPVGLQLIAGLGRDDLLLGAARSVEQCLDVAPALPATVL
jgi:aspartyl-tRNA(Asn)/glutamyl-tRNA(Gln) amidotransferase subunit A